MPRVSAAELGEAGVKAPSEKRVSGRYGGKTVAVLLGDRLRRYKLFIINSFAGRSQQTGAIAGQIAAPMRQFGAFTELFAAPMRQIGAMTEQIGAMTEQFAAMTEQFAGMTEQFAGMAEQFAGMTEQIAGMVEKLGGCKIFCVSRIPLITLTD